MAGGGQRQDADRLVSPAPPVPSITMRERMPGMAPTTFDGTHHATNDLELAELVELEARWENLRATRPQTAAERGTKDDLHRMQKAYESFHAKLVAFNNRYQPGH